MPKTNQKVTELAIIESEWMDEAHRFEEFLVFVYKEVTWKEERASAPFWLFGGRWCVWGAWSVISEWEGDNGS